MSDAIVFYFEYFSPYSYIAAHKIDALAKRHDRVVDWCPISLNHLFKKTGQAVVDNPAKLRYIARDARRVAEFHGLPLTFPKNFPMVTKIPRQTHYRLKAIDPDLATRFSLAVMKTYFGEGKDLRELEDFIEVATRQGVEAADVAASENDENAKQIAQATFDSCVSEGAFGVPFILCDRQSFWGVDRLDYLDRYLRDTTERTSG